MRRMEYITRLIKLSIAVSLILGCASAQEKHAISELAQVEKTRYVLTEGNDSTPHSLPKLTENSTISDYLEYAALNNPGLEAAFNRWKAALQKVPQARALDDPTFKYAYFIKEVETRVGPQRHKFELSQMFPWFGTLKTKEDAAALAAQARFEEFVDARNMLYYNVTASYYPLYKLSEWKLIEQENIEILKSKQIRNLKSE